jgi:hypothetical protein
VCSRKNCKTFFSGHGGSLKRNIQLDVYHDALHVFFPHKRPCVSMRACVRDVSSTWCNIFLSLCWLFCVGGRIIARFIMTHWH